MKIYYPAIFRKDREDSIWWNVSIPDVWGAVTCGNSFANAKEMAEDLLVSIFAISPSQFGFPTSLEETKNNFPNEIVELIELEIDNPYFNSTLAFKENTPKIITIGKQNYKIYGSLFDYKTTRLFVLDKNNKIKSEITDLNKKYILLQSARSVVWENIIHNNKN